MLGKKRNRGRFNDTTSYIEVISNNEIQNGEAASNYYLRNNTRPNYNLNSILKSLLKRENSTKSKSKNKNKVANNNEKRLKPKSSQVIKPIREKKQPVKPKKIENKSRNEIKKKEKKVIKPKPKKEKKEKPKKKENIAKSKPKKEKNNSSFKVLNANTVLSNENCTEFLTEEGCPNENCRKVHNYSLKFKERNNEEFARRYFTLHQDFSIIKPYLNKIYENSTLDLLFIMDCTLSMQKWINSTHRELITIIDYIKSSCPYGKVRVGFVGFGDYQEVVDKDHFYVCNFTEDIESIKKFIEKTPSFRGRDFPEDVIGGFNLGLEQDWKSTAKYAIFVGDAPCHGRDFHEMSRDDYPNGDPIGLDLLNIIEQYAERDICLYAVKITEHTNIMYDKINSKYKEKTNKDMMIANLGNSVEKFSFFVAYGASMTLKSMTLGKMSIGEFLNDIQKETIKQSNDKESEHNKDNGNENGLSNPEVKNNSIQDLISRISETEMLSKLTKPENTSEKITYQFESKPEYKNFNTTNLIEYESICHSFTVSKERNTNVDWKDLKFKQSSMESSLSIHSSPFSEGAMRYSFTSYDNKLLQKLVSKLPKEININENTLESTFKELEVMTICDYIAHQFNERVVNLISSSDLLLTFVKCFIYEMKEKRDSSSNDLFKHNPIYLCVENYIDGSYVKYNNNAGWTNISGSSFESINVAQAFSHFSWQITKGYLMIVDLQGVGGILTDPQIHCMDLTKYGEGNLGYIGIIKFFITHQCNDVCKKLGLVHPKDYIEINQEYDFFIEKFDLPEGKSIKKLCDLCFNAFTANDTELFQLKLKGYDAFCNDCKAKRKKTLKWSSCKDCKSKFSAYEYYYKMKRMSFPEQCSKCRHKKE